MNVVTKTNLTVGPAPLPTRYRAEVGENGQIIVRDVPIFAENDRGGRKFDLAWLKAAVFKDQALRSTGYSPPMHLGHHEVAIERKRAGTYALESVRLCLYDGKPKWVIFGSLAFKDEAVLSQSLRDYPYRSVEIAAGDAPGEINSLALLSTEAPYFRFPNLENLTFAALPDGSSAFAWRTKMTLVSENTAAAPAPAVTAPPAPAPAVKFAADDDRDEDDGFDYASASDSFQKATIKHLRYLSKALKMKADKNPKEGDEDEDGDDEQDEKGEHAPIVSAAAAPTDAFAQLEGRLAVTEAALAREAKQRKDEAQFTALYSELKPYDLPNLAKILRERIAKGDAEAFAAGIRTRPMPSPSATVENQEPAPAAPSSDPPEVAKFKNDPRQLEQARRLYAMFQSPSNPFKSQTVAAFLASNVVVEV